MNDATNSYYALPLRLDRIAAKKPAGSCALQESVAQNLYLLITTEFGECRHDHSYGCSIWENDFEIIANIKWKDTLSDSLEETISIHEPRIRNSKVKVEIEEYKLSTRESIRIKKKLVIRVEAMMVRTNEKFEFAEQIFIAPFSLE